ncbi:MAG: PEGA domain-containing protein [Candidatus Dojkabacteria bacterium]|nr:PEGA domain-containing protein [Candidatus Dojkabacteria bacterium]
MKNTKTALIIIGSVIAVSILIYFLPINKIIGSLPIINRFYNNTTIEIVLKNGVANVWVNEKEYGQTPQNIENLPEGEYLIELQKVTEDESFYKKHSFNIEIEKNTSSRIDLEIGPEDIIHGSIISYSSVPKISSSDGFLTITSNTQNAKIYIDGEFQKIAPISGLQLKDGQYQVKVTAEGYEDIEIPVIVRKGYLLNLKTYSFPIPVNFEESIDE